MRKEIFVFSTFIFLAGTVFSQLKKGKEIEGIAMEWAAANNEHSIEKLIPLYAPTVMFYAQSKDATTCLKEKKDFFDLYPDYSINISGVDIDFYKNGTVKCNFIKTESWKGEKYNPQPAYLLFENRNNIFYIIGESDQRMDAQRGYTPLLGAKVKQKNINSSVIIYAVIGLILVLGIIFLARRKSKSAIQPLLSTNDIPLPKAQPSVQQPEPISPGKNLTSEEKGYAFEKYVVSKFSREYFDIIEWRSDKFHKGIFAKNSMLPDLEISFSNKNVYNYFAVECKWQNNINNNKLEWAKDYQLKNYKDFEHATGKTVFIIIGIGGQPDKPRELFVLPLSKISSTELYLNDLRRYEKFNENFFYDPRNNALT